MKKFKKLIALLLAMMMVFSIAPVAAFAEGYLSFEEGIVSEPTEQKAVEQEIGVIDLVDPTERKHMTHTAEAAILPS